MDNSNNTFEQELYLIFRKFGYLFPTTEEEVDRFERLHGKTDIEMPEKFKSSDTILASLKAGSGDASEAELEQSYALAARSGKQIPEDMIERMRTDRKKSITSKNSSKKDK